MHSVLQSQDSHRSHTVSPRSKASARSSGSGPVDVVIVDHGPRASDGVRMLLARQSGIRVRGVAESGPEALILVRELRPEVCLISTTLESGTWARLASRLKDELTSIRVLLYTEEQPKLVMTALAVIAQADGVVWRHHNPDELAAHMRPRAGRAQRLAPSLAGDEIRAVIDRVEDRDRAIAAMLLQQMHPDDIARKMGISASALRHRRAQLVDSLERSRQTP